MQQSALAPHVCPFSRHALAGMHTPAPSASAEHAPPQHSEPLAHAAPSARQGRRAQATEMLLVVGS